MSRRTLTIEDLERWGLKGLIEREIIIDGLIEKEEKPVLEEEAIISVYLKSQNIHSQEELSKWMQAENIDKDALLARATRHYKWFKTCERRFKSQAATQFLKMKAKLDKISYSLVWLADEALANEIFIRLKEGETTIDEATLMSTNPPAGLKIGRIGPITIKELPDALAEILRVSQPEQIWPPIKVEDGWAIIKCEKLWPAVFNKEEKMNIILEMGERWMYEELHKS